jgi:uncharacterized PurR-regulated membrane protein YhhQ (DUF165 family)
MRLVGVLVFVVFLGLVPLANWMILHVGTTCVATGPCLIPVAPGLMAPSGVLTVGVALVLRDVVQRCLGVTMGLLAIVIGTCISILVAPPALVAASGAAFLLSEFADFAIYTPLQQRHLMLAVFASSCIGLVVDSLVFLWLAFDSLEFLAGLVVAKFWAVLFSTPFICLLRRVASTPA